ncbi:hypothetical protein FRC09_000417 [Ceratobasidium sp. 395]|nr:hypothetical protein FRC09_000417 [Ceratobasidium sp. 395]
MRFISYTLAAATTLLGSSLVSSVPISPKHIKPLNTYTRGPWILQRITLSTAHWAPASALVLLGKYTLYYTYDGVMLNFSYSGDLTDSAGSLIGHVVPGVGGETGIIDKNGNPQIDAKLIFQFKNDKKHMYAAISGVGLLTGKPYDAHHIETDSPSRLAWNSYFIVANVSLVSPLSYSATHSIGLPLN